MTPTLLAAVLAFAAAAALIPPIRKAALTLGITDVPAQGKVHRKVTPYMGGVAIAAVALVGSSLLHDWEIEATVILAAACLVGGIGFIDDLRTVGPGKRLLVEVLAASMVFAAGARVQLVGGVGDWALTVAWLVVITNAFNLLDNMDGCAAFMATVTGLGLAVAAHLEGQVLVAGMAALVAGASAGFLVHNWHPARIFMGDAGSLFLGFLLATIALKLRFPVPHIDGAVAVAFLAAPALFDTTLVVISRAQAHRPIWIGGTDHTSHRLRDLGLGTRLVSAVMATSTAACCALGILIGRGLVPTLYALAPACAVGVVLLVLLLRIPVYERGAGREFTPRSEEERLDRGDLPSDGVAGQRRVSTGRGGDSGSPFPDLRRVRPGL
ncbi:MAG: undecaprenyl/decaprenyl-phosphate alpha-N-acetylglucosaminyl 1-phosphate transferase [Actinomycetota bacterium]|nr:undecaprenyl/decaprenyl-phosphate alpha-N-acetylglucosaminyl 1-phosphate transferase [Actinomycetota bacterium]